MNRTAWPLQIAPRRLLPALLLIEAISGPASAQYQWPPAAHSPSPPPLQIEITFSGEPMPPRIYAAAMLEVTHIWAAYGVEVRVCGASEAVGGAVVRLAVMLADHQDQPMTDEVLGSIPFRNGVPEPAIVIYPNAIAALVASVRLNDRHDHDWPTALRDAVVGRVLGRALAHEIGHFLLRSRHHSANGLMRARQMAPELVAVDRRRFFLSPEEVTQLVASGTIALRERKTDSRIKILNSEF